MFLDRCEIESRHEANEVRKLVEMMPIATIITI